MERLVKPMVLIAIFLGVTGGLVGCGMKNSVMNELPKTDQAQINKSLNGNGNFKFPTSNSIPFKPTGGKATVNSKFTGTKPKGVQNSLTLKIYNADELLIINEGIALPNLDPTFSNLSDGIPAKFVKTNSSSTLSWNDSRQTYALVSESRSKQGKILTKKQLIKIADSIEK